MQTARIEVDCATTRDAATARGFPATHVRIPDAGNTGDRHYGGNVYLAGAPNRASYARTCAAKYVRYTAESRPRTLISIPSDSMSVE